MNVNVQTVVSYFVGPEMVQMTQGAQDMTAVEGWVKAVT